MNLQGRVDMHVHTVASDGKFTPREVVMLAKKLGLAGIAITDHDSVDGIEEGLAAAEEAGIDLIPGVEISSVSDDRDVHILGYWLDWRSPEFRQCMLRQQQARVTRMEEIIKKLRQNGVAISQARVEEIAGGNSVGRPHIAQAMMEKGYVKSIADAFAHWLAPGGKAFVPRQNLTPEGAVALIRQAGGVAVIAHPGETAMDDKLAGWVQAGARGMEVYHPKHDAADEEKYGKMAQELGLFYTGGSDFHHSDLGLRWVSTEQLAHIRALCFGAAGGDAF